MRLEQAACAIVPFLVALVADLILVSVIPDLSLALPRLLQ